MNYEELLKDMLNDIASIDDDFNYFNDRKYVNATVGKVNTTIINITYPLKVNFLMIQGATIAFDFMSYYWQVIQFDIQNFGSKNQITKSHVITYGQAITSCMRTYLGFLEYSYAFNSSVYKEIQIKRNFFNKRNDLLFNQLTFEKREELIKDFYICDYVGFILEYLCHEYPDFTDWYSFYYRSRKYFNNKFHLNLISETKSKENYYAQLNGSSPTNLSFLKNRISKFSYSHF